MLQTGHFTVKYIRYSIVGGGIFDGCSANLNHGVVLVGYGD
jgi:hypothetical protein